MKHKPTPEPVLVDVNGIAAMLNVSHRTARRLVHERNFPPPVRLRTCIRWWKQDVLDHVRKMTSASTTS